jgi:hypothetical protein
MAGLDQGENSCKLHSLNLSNSTSRHQSECDDGLDAALPRSQGGRDPLPQKQGHPNDLETRIPGILNAISIVLKGVIKEAQK